MASLLTPQGLKIQTLDDFKSAMKNDAKTQFGPGVNLLETQLLGQLIGIVSVQLKKLFDLQVDEYFAHSPITANGISLDNVAAITGLTRLPGTPSKVSVIAEGNQGTVIPQGSLVSVVGDPESLFKTISAYEIQAGIDEVQTLTFLSIPDEGTFTLSYDGEETTEIQFNAIDTDVQDSLNALNSLNAVLVVGDFNSGFSITFTGQDGQKPQPMLFVSQNTLKNNNNNVIIEIIETESGKLPNVEAEMVASQDGPTQALAGTLTIIETPVAGWDNVINPLDAVLGKNIETDAEFRIRRKLSLGNPGTATVEAIRARLLQINSVKAAVVYENITMEPDSSNRPPKSFEAVVLGGSDEEVSDLIWKVKPAGIETFGSTTLQILDSQGFKHDIRFSRPTEKEIYILVKATIDPNLFPVNGEQAIIQNLLDYATKELSIGDDVIKVHLFCPVTDVGGVIDAQIWVDLVDPPINEGNIEIKEDQVALFDSSRITVNLL